ncbi:DUF1883 domain-containing protein [Enterococcus faecalis]|nr:DUF1883 domain-containing protein [Enterococcus faecalis]EGO9037280.1 DUF1883 domain-containing protein [Enterococcus faecalis]
MTKYPYIQSTGPVSAHVRLVSASNVFLVDRHNFTKYKSGQRLRYFGGYFNRRDVTVSAPKAGTWYLVVEGATKYQYEFI